MANRKVTTMRKPPYVEKEFKAIKSILADLIGEIVCVSWVSDRKALRNNYEPQISVQGKLEGSAKTGKFRVLVDDNTYSYFYDDTIWCALQDEGKRAIIFID